MHVGKVGGARTLCLNKVGDNIDRRDSDKSGDRERERERGR